MFIVVIVLRKLLCKRIFLSYLMSYNKRWSNWATTRLKKNTLVKEEVFSSFYNACSVLCSFMYLLHVIVREGYRSKILVGLEHPLSVHLYDDCDEEILRQLVSFLHILAKFFFLFVLSRFFFLCYSVSDKNYKSIFIKMWYSYTNVHCTVQWEVNGRGSSLRTFFDRLLNMNRFLPDEKIFAYFKEIFELVKEEKI